MGKEERRTVVVQQGPRGAAEDVLLQPWMAEGAGDQQARPETLAGVQQQGGRVTALGDDLDLGLDPAIGEEGPQAAAVEIARRGGRGAEDDHARRLFQQGLGGAGGAAGLLAAVPGDGDDAADRQARAGDDSRALLVGDRLLESLGQRAPSPGGFIGEDEPTAS